MILLLIIETSNKTKLLVLLVDKIPNQLIYKAQLEVLISNQTTLLASPMYEAPN